MKIDVSRETEKRPDAESISIFACGDDHVHLVIGDYSYNPLAELCVTPEEALTIAKRLEAAADRALGIE